MNALVADASNARLIMGQGSAHNVVLQWALQGGTLGLVFIALVSAGWTRIIFAGLSRRSSQTSFLRAVLIAGAFVTAHGMVDYALEIPGFLWTFAWVAGLGAGVASGGKRPQSTAKPFALSVRLTSLAALSACVIVAGGAVADRFAAMRAMALDDPTFLAHYAEQPLSGSAVRLEAIGDRALRLESPRADIAVQAFGAALELEPRDGVIEAKFSYAAMVDAGMMSPDSVAALARSYDKMPYGKPEFGAWRVQFAASVWPILPPPVQDAVLREARLLPWTSRQAVERASGIVLTPP